VLVGGPGEEARSLEAQLRQGEPPVVTRVVEDRTGIDVRTVLEDEITMLGPLVSAAWGRTVQAGRRQGEPKEDPR
jgi:hypothetical protein